MMDRRGAWDEWGLRLLQKTPSSFDASACNLTPWLQVEKTGWRGRAGRSGCGRPCGGINREQVWEWCCRRLPRCRGALLEQERISECVGSLRRLLRGGEGAAAVEVEKVRQTLGLEVENLGWGWTQATIEQCLTGRAEEAADSKEAPSRERLDKQRESVRGG